VRTFKATVLFHIWTNLPTSCGLGENMKKGKRQKEKTGNKKEERRMKGKFEFKE
jgi:hypothetical protein